MLRKECLPTETLKLFDALSSNSLLQDMVLVGGTAISLHTGHRASVDLDFCSYSGLLPSHQIDQLIIELKDNGHQIVDATFPERKSQFKINTGKRLDDYARDYVIDGVKVTFFAFDGSKKTREMLSRQSMSNQYSQFSIMGLDGLFAAKSILLEKRQKSRDLFDLWWLINYEGYSLQSLFNIVESYSDSEMIDQTIQVLTGEMPIDERFDEGLKPVSVDIGVDEIYDYFRSHVSLYRQQEAQNTFLTP